MGTFKKTKVVMLPTNEKSNIVMNNIQQGLFVVGGDGILAKHRMGDCTNQHLYFLSDEEIKEGDWFLSNLNEILKCTKREDKFIWYEKLTVPGVSKIAQPFSVHINLKPKKIIATTDKSLTINSIYGADSFDTSIFSGSGKSEIVKLPQMFNLPQPSQSFLEKFVEEYNKGNVITEVLVEYEDKVAMDGHTIIGIELKVSKDNTITIRKVKDSWNRDEVEEKIRKGAYVLLNGSIGDFDKWIEENL